MFAIPIPMDSFMCVPPSFVVFPKVSNHLPMLQKSPRCATVASVFKFSK